MDNTTLITILFIAIPLVAFIVINLIIKSHRRKRDAMDFEDLTYKSTPPKAHTSLGRDTREAVTVPESERIPSVEMNVAMIREQLEKAGVKGEKLEKLMRRIQDKKFDSVETSTVVSNNGEDDFDELFGNLENDNSDTNAVNDNVSIKIENGVVQFNGDMSKLNEKQKQILMNLTGKEDLKELLEVLKKIKSLM